MRHRGVDGNNEIEHRDDGGGVGEILKFLAELNNVVLTQDRQLLGADIFLQADKIKA